jgi:uncharacterized integral membrane protein
MLNYLFYFSNVPLIIVIAAHFIFGGYLVKIETPTSSHSKLSMAAFYKM